MFRPIGDRLLIEPIIVEEKFGDIVIPTTQAQVKTMLKGKIINKGNGLMLPDGTQKDPKFKEGQIVFWINNYTQSHVVRSDGNDLLLIREGEIVGIEES